MVLDGQKVRTDGGRMDGMGGRTHGRRHFYIPLTSLGDKKKTKKKFRYLGEADHNFKGSREH